MALHCPIRQSSYEKCVDRIKLVGAFNVRDGFNRKDDTFPKRMLVETLNTRGAPGDGQIIKNLDGFLNRYYAIRGWTLKGIPSPQKLDELGLSYVVKDMV